MPRTRYNFWIDEAQREGLRLVKARDGVLESEQIRRAIDLWLDAKGARLGPTPERTRTLKMSGRKRATTGSRKQR